MDLPIRLSGNSVTTFFKIAITYWPFDSPSFLYLGAWNLECNGIEKASLLSQGKIMKSHSLRAVLLSNYF